MSGPSVWPRIYADHAADRFIFRRPELPYIVAKKRMLEHREQQGVEELPQLMGVRFQRVYSDGGRIAHRGMQRFGHPINHDDPEEDVKDFLKNLRRMLVRSVPDQPLLNCAIQLRFYDFMFKGNQLLSWQEKWL